MAHEPQTCLSYGTGRQRQAHELDITLDAVVDDNLVKDLSQIVETQEATKQQLLNQIASVRQLERLQAVSDAGTLPWSI